MWNSANLSSPLTKYSKSPCRWFAEMVRVRRLRNKPQCIQYHENCEQFIRERLVRLSAALWKTVSSRLGASNRSSSKFSKHNSWRFRKCPIRVTRLRRSGPPVPKTRIPSLRIQKTEKAQSINQSINQSLIQISILKRDVTQSINHSNAYLMKTGQPINQSIDGTTFWLINQSNQVGFIIKFFTWRSEVAAFRNLICTLQSHI